MIATLILLCILTLCSLRKRSTFLTLIATFHLTPTLCHLTGRLLPLTQWHYAAVSLITALSLVLLLPQVRTNSEDVKLTSLFLATGALFFLLFSQWEALYPIGERIRDMALLTITDREPFNPSEPWLPGYPVPYYLFWYRCARFFRYLINGTYVNAYTSMLAFSAALLITSAYAISRIIFQRGERESILVAAVVTLGSNPAGVLNVLNHSEAWWGPSRVIKGVITEFPGWSFLLGDAHPHVLNLGTSLFCFFVALLSVFSLPQKRSLITGATMSLLLITFLRAANPWEVPLWCGIIIMLFVIFLFRIKRNDSHCNELFFKHEKISEPIRISWCFLTALSAYALFISVDDLPTRVLTPALVSGTIAQTTSKEIFLHWGIPLTLLIFSLRLSKFSPFYRAILAVVALLLLFKLEAWPFLFFILAALIIDTFAQKRPYKSIQLTRNALVGLILTYIIMTEFFFLDDPYGGEHERMNTIFKLYSFAWSPFLLFCWLTFTERWSLLKGKYSFMFSTVNIGAACTSLLFFCWTAWQLRSPVHFASHVPREFSVLETKYPGVTKVIQKLRELPLSTLLEPQGPAYTYSTFISSLTGHYSYLGWANHVNLLTGQHAEVRRRQQITSLFYSPTVACYKKKALLKEENIHFAALGYNHHGALQRVHNDSFSCLSVVINTPSVTLVTAHE